jgi:hypothetical protein
VNIFLAKTLGLSLEKAVTAVTAVIFSLGSCVTAWAKIGGDTAVEAVTRR